MIFYPLEVFRVLIPERVLIKMKLTKQIEAAIKKHAIKVSPEECCGFLVESDEGAIKISECKNISKNKKEHFKISIEDYLQALVDGDIFAVYHSHTKEDSSFSEADEDICNNLEMVSVLYNTETDNFQILEPKINEQ